MNQMFAVIVNPTETKAERRSKIIDELCDGQRSHLHDMTEAGFEKGMRKALDEISAEILKVTNSTVL